LIHDVAPKKPNLAEFRSRWIIILSMYASN
jgi:hypothetical protein